jgi:uncharacterized protein (TIGR02996 family)
MHSDEPFLTKLHADPADDTTRLVYADWLEEQGDDVSIAKAEFLRLTVDLAGQTKKRERSKREKRLQELAAGLDTDWLPVVSHLAVENCHAQEQEGTLAGRPIVFEVLCDKKWQGLRPTEDHAVRFCEGCQQHVHYCDTIVAARRHAAEGHCIAVDLGVIRRPGDLQTSIMMLLGRPSPQELRRERELNEPDKVSAERERRKQQHRTEST